MTVYDPIAYTYDADYHCPPCSVARYGAEPGRTWPRDDARDAEDNALGAVFDTDEWTEPSLLDTDQTLACATCGRELDTLAADPDAMTWRARGRYMLESRYGTLENTRTLGASAYHGRLWHMVTGRTSSERGQTAMPWA